MTAKDIYLEESYREIKLSTGINKYEILGTTRFKKINKVFVQTKQYSASSQRKHIISDIIESFDINSTQVGVDISTRQVFFSKHFVDYLFTKQLEVVNWNTPSHSLIRLLKKTKELGVYSNTEESILLASVLTSGFKGISDIINDRQAQMDENSIDSWTSYNSMLLETTPLFFGKKQLKDYNLFKSELSSFDLLKRVAVGKSTSEIDYEWFGEKEDNSYELNSLVPSDKEKCFSNYLSELNQTNLIRGMESRHTNRMISNLESVFFDMNKAVKKEDQNISVFTSIYTLPLLFKSCKKVRKQSVHFLNESFRLCIDEASNSYEAYKKHPLEFAIAHKVDAFEFIGVDDLNTIRKKSIFEFRNKSKKHGELNYLYNETTFAQVEALTETLNILEKKYGDLIYGVIGRHRFDAKNLTVENVTPYIEALMSKKGKIVKECLINHSSSIGTIKDLVSGLELFIEGSEMGHCVGGYQSQIASGSSIILAMKNSTERRMTMELQPYLLEDGSTNYKINQIFGKRNESIKYEECKDLLEEVNKVYSILPIDVEKHPVFQVNRYEYPENINNDIELPQGVPAQYRPPVLDFDFDEIPF